MGTGHYLQIFGLTRLPEIRPQDDLVTTIVEGLSLEPLALQPGDILILAQKIVSKAENRLVDLETVLPSAFAAALAKRMGKDPRLLEIILRESRRIVRMDARILITETHHGFICANAGVDQSNVEGRHRVCLLPLDPDASAKRLGEGLAAHCGVSPAVLISDSFGRPWREGLVNVALGAYGIDPLIDYRGQADAQGHPLKATVIAVADELCSAAELVMGKTAQQPAAIVRGYRYQPSSAGAQGLLRPPARDLFR